MTSNISQIQNAGTKPADALFVTACTRGEIKQYPKKGNDNTIKGLSPNAAARLP